MPSIVKRIAIALCFAFLAAPLVAQERAYAPEDLRTLSYNDQVRVISLEYSEQSNGRRIPDDQLRFYIDQVNRSNWGFSQIKADIAKSLGGNTGPQPVPGGTIRCESVDGRAQTCRTPWSGPTRLVRQLSKSPCEEGRTWQSQQGQVYVGNGCRGEFAAAPVVPPITGSIRCESADGRARTCRTPWSGTSRLMRQLSKSPCEEGRTWQSQQGQVYVSNGCRGEFAAAPVAPPTTGSIRCESSGSRDHTCNTPWRGRSRLQRQLSNAACTQGRSWGWKPGQVWVSNGCRGEFVQVRDTVPAPYTVTCTSSSVLPTTCDWDRNRGRPYLLQQLSNARCTEGLTWGYNTSRGLWVSAGCRARFGAR
ncbi:DUF3011 domain-containing protein [Lysobacter sp. CFH 32150]|uniref:DUF3011 domain-containing protein n=1 Tax=Lysobacter sp. CFH 32150 TaxID=2927128 RepID=UPI001FA78450|nr:DUF3011 domain-containing protein [Lysobacter sp. CFH 32150]MCI4567758.1 DUF3011 domain-containing protein [Lysobacter sp. CFH 32150]